MAWGSFSGGGGNLGFGVVFTLYDEFSPIVPNIQAGFRSIEQGVERMTTSIRAGFMNVRDGMHLMIQAAGMLAPVMHGIEVAATFEKNQMGMELVLHNAKAAADVMASIKEDFMNKTNIMDPEKVQEANAGLIKLEVGAKEAHDAVLGLSRIMAAMGNGNTQFKAAVFDLQKIKELEATDKRHFQSLTMSGLIPIMQVMKQWSGMTSPAILEQIKHHKIHFEEIADAIKKATSEGGYYAGAMEKLATTTAGKIQWFHGIMKYVWADVGNAVKPVFDNMIDKVSHLLVKFDEFAQTSEGKFAIQIGAGALAVAGMALAFSGLGFIIVGLMKTLSALSALVMNPFTIGLGILAYGLWQMTGTVERLTMLMKGLWDVMSLSNTKELILPTDIADKLEKAGLLEFVLQVGVWYQRIKAFLHGVYEEFKWMAAQAQKALNVVIGILGFFGLVLETSTASLNGWSNAGRYLAEVIGIFIIRAFIVMALTAVAKTLPVLKSIWLISRAIFTFVWESLVLIAEWGAAFFVGVMGPIWAIVVAYAEAAAMWIATTVSMAASTAAAWLVAFWPFVLIGAAVATLIYLIYENWDAVKALGSAIGEFFDWVWQGILYLWTNVIMFFKWLVSLPERAMTAGINIAMSLWEGVKQVFSNMMDWIADAWNNSFMGQMFNFVFGVDGKGNSTDSGSSTDQSGGSSDGKTSLYIPTSLRSLLDQQADTKAGYAAAGDPTILNNTTETVRDIIVPLSIDGELIYDNINQRQQMEDARS